MALALYRRYRPDTFAGVIGQDQVTVPLMRALDEHKLTHAYLFSGPRGCGKTSSARILARCVNCAEGPTSQPCGVCESCRDLATGGPGSIDVVEIDAASHNGVDDARELRERAGFAPARDRYKIFILDEAHMVTQQGFNALLKIVEEPPEHVMFIFATTEPEKVIGTIRSRTHHYPFRLVPPEVMGPYLEEICEHEQIEAEPGVLRLAMRAGGGSVRDTLSVLDQLMVGAVDGEISYDAAVALLGFTPDVLIGTAIDAIIDHDGAKLYDVIQKVIVGGFDARRFVEDLLARTRDLLVLTLGGDQAERVLSDDAAAEDLEQLHRQAKALGLPTLTAMAETMDDALAHMAGAISPRMRLELLAAKLLAGRETGYAAINTPAKATADDPTKPAPHGGFIANQAKAQQQPAPAQSAQQPASPQQPAPAQSGWPDMAARTSAQPAQSAQPAATTDGSPDERWDALVRGLPADVRAYVDRTKVPRINLAQDPRSGRSRLWIKFDTPMSKYAFALAVSAESVDGTTKVVDILRAQVHRVFGPQVALAPTEKMADGQVAPPLSKLPADQQQRIKAQLLQGSLQSQIAGRAEREPSEHSAAAGEATSDADAVHRVAPAQSAPAASAAASALDDIDPWAYPEDEQTHIDFDRVSSFEQQAAQARAAKPDDPWQRMPGESAPDRAPAQPAAAPAQPEPVRPEPQVDPDEDEYSMTDESISTSMMMDLDAVKELFDVKSVEDFSADDPKNPRNLQAQKHHDEH
ncbi:DNA polymerase III subunit gamma/tau [Bifidobacterium pseudolongum]|uniref:DNA polymerase III subunit gamma/tau n=1 Tax=Bifidobacterium pseudolongum TaxID=1694 RepID=UPI001022851F|nr:DNA polymerase III subunit gamma/tau [Bifidobacterium pseudolongum]RYQ08522.1 DNA polymerase III subunit gamma/tau [Bifidobacterium pseudolongum subsp. globosum]